MSFPAFTSLWNRSQWNKLRKLISQIFGIGGLSSSSVQLAIDSKTWNRHFEEGGFNFRIKLHVIIFYIWFSNFAFFSLEFYYNSFKFSIYLYTFHKKKKINKWRGKYLILFIVRKLAHKTREHNFLSLMLFS